MPAECAAVRDQLGEHAVGVLSPRERRAVERHLEWCAACRKEAEELASAAATLPFALASAAVPESLFARVRDAVVRMAHPSALRRGRRSAGAIAIAAMVAILALGWGAVMAGRAELFQARVRAESTRRVEELRRFTKAVQELSGIGTDVPMKDALFATLDPTDPAAGTTRGAAMELVLRKADDFAMVQVSGLSQAGAPYGVVLQDSLGHSIRMGAIAATSLDQDGAGEIFHRFHADLRAYTTVVVRDAHGGVVLRGVVGLP